MFPHACRLGGPASAPHLLGGRAAGAGRRQQRRRQAAPRAAAAPQLDLPDGPAAAEPTVSGAEAEAREELALAASRGDIYGIPRAEWLKLQSPAR